MQYKLSLLYSDYFLANGMGMVPNYQVNIDRIILDKVHQHYPFADMEKRSYIS
jgi:agmatine/peptidylarginine deiminase